MLETYKVRKKDRKLSAQLLVASLSKKKVFFCLQGVSGQKLWVGQKKFSSKSCSRQMINEQNGTNPISKKWFVYEIWDC